VKARYVATYLTTIPLPKLANYTIF
jgi:hypothetical protein